MDKIYQITNKKKIFNNLASYKLKHFLGGDL